MGDFQADSAICRDIKIGIAENPDIGGAGQRDGVAVLLHDHPVAVAQQVLQFGELAALGVEAFAGRAVKPGPDIPEGGMQDRQRLAIGFGGPAPPAAPDANTGAQDQPIMAL